MIEESKKMKNDPVIQLQSLLLCLYITKNRFKYTV